MLFGISTALITALALTLVPIRTSAAQGSVSRVQIALVDSLSSPQARAEVIRFSDERPPLILLRSATVNKDDIITAITALQSASADRPDRAGLVGRLTIVGEPQATAASDRVVRRAESILRRLKSGPSVKIGNVGRGRWGEFDVQ